jgi:hypothetical protein
MQNGENQEEQKFKDFISENKPKIYTWVINNVNNKKLKHRDNVLYYKFDDCMRSHYLAPVTLCMCKETSQGLFGKPFKFNKSYYVEIYVEVCKIYNEFKHLRKAIDINKVHEKMDFLDQ